MRTNSRKKVYLCPTIEVLEVETLSMLASSKPVSIDPRKDRFGTEAGMYINWKNGNDTGESMEVEDWSNNGW